MAGYDYHLTPQVEKEERYDVSTGELRRGSYVLDSTNLNVGDWLPPFAPICADLKYKKCNLVRNMKVYEAYTTGDTALTIKVAKGSFPFVGMFIARVSRGRTIREFIVGVLLIPTGFTLVWMGFMGNATQGNVQFLLLNNQ